MTDYPAPQTTGVATAPPLSATLIAYGLMGAAGVVGLVTSGLHFIAPLFGLLGVAALVICYVKRGEAQGTWVATHLRWMVRTFWFSLLWSVIGWILVLTIVGIVIAVPLWLAVSIWILYRVVRGYLLFKDSKPVPGM